MKSNVKVYAIFKEIYALPFNSEALIELYQFKDDAEIASKKLNDENDDPPSGDDYGFYSGCRYGVVELEVK